MAKGNGRTGSKPLLQFEHIERQPLPSCRVDVKVQELIRQYGHYIKELTGYEPGFGELIEKAMGRVLSSDAGFKEWLAKQGAGAMKQPSSAAATKKATENATGMAQRTNTTGDAG